MDHNYCVEPNQTFMHDLEVKALRWCLEDHHKELKEKTSCVNELKKVLSTFDKRRDNHKNYTDESEVVSKEDVVILEQIKKIMSPSQLALLSHPEKKFVHWTQKEKSEAIALHSIFPRAYRYLKEKLHYPLPSESSIYRWLGEAEILPDKVIQPVISILESLFSSAPAHIKQCGLAMDEVSIDSSLCYDPIQDRIFGKEKNATVFTVRGLLSGWKQVLYFTFDSNVTKDLLFSIINAIHNAGGELRSLPWVPKINACGRKLED